MNPTHPKGLKQEPYTSQPHRVREYIGVPELPNPGARKRTAMVLLRGREYYEGTARITTA